MKKYEIESKKWDINVLIALSIISLKKVADKFIDLWHVIFQINVFCINSRHILLPWKYLLCLFHRSVTWSHYLLFGIFVQKLFETNLNFSIQMTNESEKIKPLMLCQLSKLIKQKCLYLCWFFTRENLKLKFLSNTFWTKFSKNSHNAGITGVWGQWLLLWMTNKN